MIAPIPKVESEVARLLAMARAQGLPLATGEEIRRQAIIDGTRRDTGADQ